MVKRSETVILERRFFPQDAVVIQEGEMGSQAFLIQSGSVRVYTGKDGNEIELARLGVGQIIGEMALIFDGPRTASVQALQDCNLIVITRQQFKEKLETTDSTIRAVIHMLTNRIIDTNNTLINKKSDLGDLRDTAQLIYQNVLGSLPRNQQRVFQSNVLPSLESLLESIEGFQDRYEIDQDSSDN